MTDFEEDCHRWHGKSLTGKYPHYCPDWDYLPIDSTVVEFEFCTCPKLPEGETRRKRIDFARSSARVSQ